MKFYVLLCVVIALTMLLTPAIALVGTQREENTAVSAGENVQTPEETTEQEQTTITDQDR